MTVDGQARTPENVFNDTSQTNAIRVVLPATDALRHGETVTLSYTPPGPDAPPDDAGRPTVPLADAAGNEVAAFANLAVANPLPPGPPEAPENLAAAAGGTKAALSWSAPFDGGAPVARYQVRWKTGAAAGGDWEDVPESGPETASHTVSGLEAGTQYTFQVRAVNVHGNGEPASVTATLADDDVAPAPATAEVGAGGLVLTLTFDEALDAASIPDPAAFAVTVQGTARPPAAAAVLDQPDALILTLPAPVRPGEAVTVSYTGPAEAGGRPLQDGARNPVAAFAGLEAANGLPAAAPEAPENLQAAETGAGGAVTLSWRPPWANGSAITKYRLRYVEGTGAGGDWADIPMSGPDGANAGRHTVTGLTDGTPWTFQVLAVNAEGEGEPATLIATPEDRTAPVLTGRMLLGPGSLSGSFWTSSTIPVRSTALQNSNTLQPLP